MMDKIPNTYIPEIPKSLICNWNALDIDEMKAKYTKKNTGLKFLDRKIFNTFNWKWCLQYLPEYTIYNNKIYNVIDISAACGSSLEVIKHFNNNVFATDNYTSYNGYYKEALSSQNIPQQKLNIKKLPYDITSKSYDLLIHAGAIHFCNFSIWDKIIDEFTRISKKTIIISLNTMPDDKMCIGKNILSNWKSIGWDLVYNNYNVYKWEYKN